MRSATLLLSILLCIAGTAGIAWIIAMGSITSVDGLFMGLILLSISGVFALNVYWELRASNLFWLPFKKKGNSLSGQASPQGKTG